MWKCAGVCEYVCWMNFQNIFWRLESIHQRTLIRMRYPIRIFLCIKQSVMNKKFTRKPRKNCFAEFYNFDSPEVLSLMSKVICKVLKNSEVYFDLTQKLFL